jgi:phage shock protein PspC (stress-responsive transcriptional regulator)
MDTTTNQNNPEAPKVLRRAVDGRMLGGVAAGLAKYFELDVALMRVILVVLSFLGGAGVPLYVAAWLLIPEEGSEVPIASELLSNVRSR